MARWSRLNAPGLVELPVFAHATIAGDHIYVSGMLGVKDDFSGLVDGGIAAETTQALHPHPRAHRGRLCRAAVWGPGRVRLRRVPRLKRDRSDAVRSCFAPAG